MARRFSPLLLAAGIALALGGRVALAAAGGSTESPDPWEPFNRAIFTFNDRLDRYAIQPVARGWDCAVPDPAERGIANFFDNLRSPIRVANDILQGEVDRATVILGRFVVNSTVGLGGFLDPAAAMDLPAHKANFGQTLGRWGVPPGPYLVLPFWGSSDIRATVGLVVDGYLGVSTFFVNVPILVGSAAVDAVNRRALMLGEVERARQASLDLYVAARNAYFQQREELVKGAERARREREEELYFPDLDEQEEP